MTDRPRIAYVEEAKKDPSTALGKALGWLAFPFLVPWLVMLALGVLHHDVAAVVPPLGYWAAVILRLGVILTIWTTRRAWVRGGVPAKEGKPHT